VKSIIHNKQAGNYPGLLFFGPPAIYSANNISIRDNLLFFQIKIMNFLMNIDQPEILKHFTYRRPMPLILLASDKDKIRKSDEMRETLASGGYSQIPLDF